MIKRAGPAAITDILLAGAALAVLCWWGLHAHFWKDFFFEAQPAAQRLLAGDLHGFFALSPVYGGSMLVRAPFFLAGNAVGGITGAYRLAALACAVALAGLALALAARMRVDGRAPKIRRLAIALCVCNPIAVRALQIGHPEDLLAGALVVGGVMLAIRGSGAGSGLALGVALASKQWAVIALPIALVVLPRGQRIALLGACAAAAVALLAPFALASPARFSATNRGLATVTDAFINPDNLWRLVGAWHWRPLGGPRSAIFGPASDAIAGALSRPLIVAVPFALSFAWWRRRGRLRPDDALLLLAACCLLRCMLDPWNIVYYQLPFIIALLAWESRNRAGAPVMSLAATGAVWVTFQTIGTNASGDPANATLGTAVFAAWAIPATVLLVARSLRARPELGARRLKPCELVLGSSERIG